MRAPDAHRLAHRARGAQLTASAGLIVLVLLVVLLGDARINSGSDAGGKTVTVARIAESGMGGVDVGYWAEAHDPDGRHHPLIKTTRTDEGWVQVTSALMPAASAPGERMGGSVGALWLSILAVPVGALAAARIARRLGAPDGWVAFVVVGALSPLTFYGTDQWEHAPALAAGLWATTLLLERPPAGRAVVAGAVAGLAVALRRETGLFLAVLAVAEILTDDGRAHWLRFPRRVGSVVASGTAVLAASVAFDRAVLGRTLGDRSADQVTQAGTDVAQRLSDGLLTTISQYPTLAPAELLIGSLALVGVATAAWGWRSDDPVLVRVGGAMAVISVLARIFVGTGFVPGAFAVLPLTAAAPCLARREGRHLGLVAVAAATATICLQWTGSLNAQWGGRYLLLPAAAVAVVAAAEIERRGWRHPAAVVALGSTAVLAALGLTWHIERTNGIASTLEDLEAAAEPGDVVISTHPHLVREIGFAVVDQRWLRAENLGDVPSAFDVAAAADADHVRLLHSGRCAADGCDHRWASGPGDRTIDGWESIGMVTVDWLGDRGWILEAFAAS